MHLQGTEYPPPASLKKELIATVREEIGPIATPDVIHWAPGSPTALASSHMCMTFICAWLSSGLPVAISSIKGKSRDDWCMRECMAVCCRAAKDQVWQDHAPHPQKDCQQVRVFILR